MSLHADTSTRAYPYAHSSRGLAAFLTRQALSGLRAGSLRVTLPSGEIVERRGSEPGLDAEVALHTWRAVRRLASGGDVGFARAFIDGDWSSPDLTAFIELVARNGAAFCDPVKGSALFRAANFAAHWLRANTRAGARRNIEAHYDLGNDFYREWLDDSMLYSSAIFADPSISLEDAQRARLARILELLDLSPGQSALEIGFGWGALARAMAGDKGARVEGVTLSPSQLAFSRDRIAAAGLSDRVDFRLEDYRDTRGQFDRIASIEMIEAVGEKYWPSYFGALHDRLKPGGVAVLQAITIAEDRFDAYRARPDFIQRYVFPGGFLPTKSAIAQAAVRAGLRLQSSEHFGQSYAMTLAEWRKRFNEAWPRIERQGFDASFRRLWTYYFSYCEAGFRAGVIDVGLYQLVRAD